MNAISWAPAVLPLYAALFSASGERDSRGSQQMKRRLASGGCDNLVKIWLWRYMSEMSECYYDLLNFQ